MPLHLSWSEWEAFLGGLYERDERLERCQPDLSYPPGEAVDAYALSAHAEAMRSSEVDGDLPGTLADLELEAGSEEEGWKKVKDFYLERGCVLLEVGDEGDEWILAEDLARRLGLLS